MNKAYKYRGGIGILDKDGEPIFERDVRTIANNQIYLPTKDELNDPTEGFVNDSATVAHKVIVDETQMFTNVWICYIPIVLFFLLDCYYLGLERAFRGEQRAFLRKVPSGDYVNDLYEIKSLPKFWRQLWNTVKAMRSFSTTPFYGLIALFVFILGKYYNGGC